MGMVDDILSWMDNKRRVAGRNVSDLVQNPRDYLSMTAANIPQTVKEYGEDPMNFIGGGVGKIAYHGSPYKFDKFQMDKIGTGEGAQAYGHGLYLAENPSVAREYQERLGGFQPSEITWQFKDLIAGLPASAQKFLTESQAARTPIDQMKQKALQSKVQAASWDAQDVKQGLKPSRADYVSSMDEAIAFLEKSTLPKPPNPGHMYKTDIPDEAVARFLDWDKPLSQQSEAVRNLIAQRGPLDDPRTFGFKNPEKVKGADIYNILARGSQAKPGIGEAGVSEAMRNAGIPGIRYLDGGSRSAGQGSSNFVVFDPELIRILERNGQATGAKPWKHGELDIFKDTTADPEWFTSITR